MPPKHNALVSTSFTPDRQHGFTLLEAMIALVIFSVGLLGLAGMQMTGLQSNHSAMLRTIATQQSYDMAERLRSNRAGKYLNPQASSVESADLTDWNNVNAKLLPSGKGDIKAVAGGGFLVTVRWDEDRSGATGTNCKASDPNDLKCIQLSVVP